MSQKVSQHQKHKKKQRAKKGTDDEDDVNRYCQFHIGDEEEDDDENEDDELPPLSSSTVSNERNDRESSAESALEMLEGVSLCRCAHFLAFIALFIVQYIAFSP